MCKPIHSSNVVTNQKWVLTNRPNGMFDPEKDVKLVAEEIILDCEDDEVIVKTEVLSGDAFIRTMLDAEAYHGSIPIGGTVPALGYGKVVCAGSKSNSKVGTCVQGLLGAQTYAKAKASQVFTKINFPLMPPTACLGLMGLTSGLTAYAGVFYVCQQPKKGETVVVTGAAGAVGSIAAQLAKSTGATVIGVAGGERKQKYLIDQLKLDHSIDYKNTKKSVSEQLEEVAPNGIDFIYDNVGGKTLDDLLSKIKPNGRVVICGAISQYSGKLNKGLVEGPSNYIKLAERGATMKGFNVMQYLTRIPFMLFGMYSMYLRSKVSILQEHVEQGIETFPIALHKMFTGEHIGKMIVNVNEA